MDEQIGTDDNEAAGARLCRLLLGHDDPAAPQRPRFRGCRSARPILLLQMSLLAHVHEQGALLRVIVGPSPPGGGRAADEEGTAQGRGPVSSGGGGAEEGPRYRHHADALCPQPLEEKSRETNIQQNEIIRRDEDKHRYTLDERR